MTEVPLEHAMLVWNRVENGGGALIVHHPDTSGSSKRYYRSDCACSYPWRTLTTPERLSILFATAWQAVIRDGVSPTEMHQALSVIPEFRAEMTPDMPRCGERA